MGRWRRSKTASKRKHYDGNENDGITENNISGDSPAPSSREDSSSHRETRRADSVYLDDESSHSNPFQMSASSSAVSLGEEPEETTASESYSRQGSSGVAGYRSSGGGSKRKSSATTFTSFDREHLWEYLVAYRDGVIRYLDGEKMDVGKNGGGDNKSDYQSIVRIAGHDFPALTEDLLQKPYLALPATLSSKQRKCLHDICVDVGLFHTGVGEKYKGNNRHIVISVYIDGLEYVPDLSAPLSIPVRNCKPWFYRNEHPIIAQIDPGVLINEDETSIIRSVSEETPPRANTTRVQANGVDNAVDSYVKRQTKIGRDMVQSLVDQPGRCLRDAHDSIDFVEMDGQGLSDHPPPGGHDEQGKVLPWMLVDTAEKMQQCAKEIMDSHPSEIGFDLEMHNQSKYMQVTCLLQLCTDEGKDYVVDVLAPGVWEAVSLLAPIFADPNIVKIGHCIGGMDVTSLHRDFGIFVVNAFDTYEAAKVLNLKRSGLATLCEHYGLRSSEEYALLKKEYQNTDWRRRPLTEPMIRYGRYDVHYLVKLRLLLIRDLTRGQLFDRVGLDHEEEAQMVARALAETLRACQRYEDGEEEMGDTGDSTLNTSFASAESEGDGDGYFTPFSESDDEDDEFFDGVEGKTPQTEHHKKKKSLFPAKELRMHLSLMKAISVSQERCLCLWTEKKEPPEKNDTLISVIRKSAFGGTEWNEFNMSLYRKLAEWRESVAEKEGTMPGIVCSLDFLVSVAYKLPIDKPGLKRLSYFLPEMLEDKNSDYVGDMLMIVKSALEQNEEQITTEPHPILTYRSRQVEKAITTTTMNGEEDEKSDDNAPALSQAASSTRAIDLSEGNENKETKPYLTSTRAVSLFALIAISAGIIVLVKKRRR